MKTLYIVRHAKSSWDHPELDDSQRPLTEKGIKRTQLVINYLLANNVHVDLVLSSHAVRAHETAKIIANSLQYPKDKIVISEDIYFGSPDSFFDVLYGQENGVDSLMMVGHNPGFTYFANYFLEQKIDNLPTSGIVGITFDTNSWENIANSGRRVKFVISPKSVRDTFSGNRN